MGKGMTGSLEQRLDRAEFFRWGKKSIKRAVGDFVNSTIEQMKDERFVMGWSKLASENVIGARPRMYFTKGQPFFVVSRDKSTPAVFSGNCVEDGGLLEWRDTLAMFYCPFCGSKYDRQGKAAGDSKISLEQPETRVLDGYVMVRL